MCVCHCVYQNAYLTTYFLHTSDSLVIVYKKTIIFGIFDHPGIDRVTRVCLYVVCLCQSNFVI